MDQQYTEDTDHEVLKQAVTDSPADPSTKPALNSTKADLVAWLNSQPEAPPSNDSPGLEVPGVGAHREDEATQADAGSDDLTDEDKRRLEASNPYNPDAEPIVVGNTPVPTRNEDTPARGGRFRTEDFDTSAYAGVDEQYMNAANPQDRPFAAEGGEEQDLEEKAQYDIEAAPLRGGLTQGDVA